MDDELKSSCFRGSWRVPSSLDLLLLGCVERATGLCSEGVDLAELFPKLKLVFHEFPQDRVLDPRRLRAWVGTDSKMPQVRQ